MPDCFNIKNSTLGDVDIFSFPLVLLRGNDDVNAMLVFNDLNLVLVIMIKGNLYSLASSNISCNDK